MGQATSVDTPAPASQQMSNVLPRDAGAASVRVQCVEVSNGTLEKLQALMRNGCDAQALSALPCKALDVSCDATIAEVRALLAPAAPATDADAADSKPLHLFAVRKTTEVSTATSEEEANGLLALPDNMSVGNVIDCSDVVSVYENDGTRMLLLVYSLDRALGDDMMGACCIVAIIAAICACCVGLCCCGAAAMSKSNKQSTNNNNNNHNNNTNYNQNQSNQYNNNNGNNNNGNYMANPNYGSQPMNNYGLPPNQGQQYGNQGAYQANNNNVYNNGTYQQQQPAQTGGSQTNPLQPAPL